MKKILVRCLLAFTGEAQRLKRNIEAEFIAKLESIYDRSGRVVDTHVRTAQI